MSSYSGILLIAASFWFSVSAGPQDNTVSIDDFVDFTTTSTLRKISDAPEPYRTRLTELLQEARHKDWNSINDYGEWLTESASEIYRDLGSKGNSRNFKYSKEGHAFMLSVLVALAPTTDRLALDKQFDKLLEEEHDNIQNFDNQVKRIFKEVTGVELENHISKMRKIMNRKRFNEE